MNSDNQEAEVQLEAKIEEKKNKKFSQKMRKQDYNFKKKAWSLRAFLWAFATLSFIASFSSKWLIPYLTSLATNLQTQNLYAGFRANLGSQLTVNFMARGHAVLRDSVVGKPLYGSLCCTAILSLFIAGIFLFQLYLSNDWKGSGASKLLPLFYLMVILLVLVPYASIFVLPFIMWSLDLARYPNDRAGDNT